MTIKYEIEPMKKIASLLLCFCLLTAFIPTTPAEAAGVSSSFLSNCSNYYKGDYYDKLAALNLSGNKADDIIAVARSQIGYHEGSSSTDLSGNSSGTGDYTEYGRYCGTNGVGWCMFFVTWCLRAIGVTDTPNNPFYMSQWANSSAIVYSWKDYINGAIPGGPKKGDIVLYWTSSSNSQSGAELIQSGKTINRHIAILESWTGSTYYTIDGNTTRYSDSDSEWVMNKQRTIKNADTGLAWSGVYIYAIIRPSYNQCSHNSAYYNDGRCTLCGAWLPNANDNASCTVGTYRVVSGKTAYFRAHPYRVSDETIGELLGSLSAGTQVSVTGAVVNGLGNTWYKVSYGGHEGYIVNDSLEFVAMANSTLKIDIPAANYSVRDGLPSGAIVGGKSWGLLGTISSNYQLTEVACHVYNSSGADAITPYMKSDINAKSYNIKTGGMNNAIRFGGLANGDYQIVISAWDASMTYRDVVSWFSIVPANVTTYNVSYDANGGTGAPGSQTKTQGTALTLSSTVPTRTMYVFKGWSTSSTGGVQYQPGGSYTTDAEITLYAVWEKGTYTITYNDNGGTGGPGTQTFTYSSGERFSTVVPTRTGYSFVNWRDDWGGDYYNPGDPIPEPWGSNTMVAQWQANNYTISYNDNGGTGGPGTQTFTYSSGERFSTAVPTRTGYSFVNWKDDWEGGYYNPGDPIPEAWGNNTLSAQWSVNYYTIDVNGWIDGEQTGWISGYGTFDLYINGNLDYINGILETSGIDDYCAAWPYGTTYEIKNIRLNDGYSFDGFLTDESVSYSGYTNKGRIGTITENTSVNIMLHTCPASIDENPEPAIFGGHTYYYFSTPVTWYDAKSICENMGGHLATITSEDEDKFVFGLAQSTLPWLGATDVENEGIWKWITGEEFSYTNWHPDNPDNYSDNPEGAENYLHYSGAGNGVWNDNSGCNLFPFVCEVDSASYTLKFDANGGTGSMDSLTPQYKEPVKLPACSFTKSGYTFVGWNLRRDSDMRWYVYPRDMFLPENEIAESGLSKTVYRDGETMWIGGYDGSESYTFVAVWAQPDLVLPAALTSIEEEAFAGGAFRFVKLPEKAVSIGWHAFADCPNLAYIYIPATVTEIDAETFGKATNLTIIGTSGSTAETFARAHGFAFLVG